MLKTINVKGKMFGAAALLAAVALLAAALGLAGFTPVQAAASPDQPTKRTINVTGDGTVTAAPDIAYITLGVITEDKDAGTAQKDNASAMSKVVTVLKASGIKSEDIKTTNFSIYPKYDYNKANGVSNIIGYTCSNNVQVTIRDITKVGPIIDAASDSGVNMTSNISFGLSNPEKYYNDALKKAVQTAKGKAETMASIYGVTLKTPVTITENGGYNPVYPIYAMKADSAAGAAPSTPVEAGTMDIKASVSMVYEY